MTTAKSAGVYKRKQGIAHNTGGVNATSEVLTLHDASLYLKVSERTIWQLAKDGKVPHGKVGNQYRFTRAQLTAWLEEQNATPK